MNWGRICDIVVFLLLTLQLLGSLKEFLGRRAELVEGDARVVVDWKPDLLPAILVEVREGHAADSTVSLLEDGVFVPEIFTSRVHGVGGVIAIASHQNMSFLTVLLALRVEDVREAR